MSMCGGLLLVPPGAAASLQQVAPYTHPAFSAVAAQAVAPTVSATAGTTFAVGAAPTTWYVRQAWPQHGLQLGQLQPSHSQPCQPQIGQAQGIQPQRQLLQQQQQQQPKQWWQQQQQHPSLVTALPSAAPSAGSSTSSSAGVSVAGNVWRLSRRPEGCRQVQAALESAATDDEREGLSTELHGHVLEAAKCMNANHVLQKVIMTSNAHTAQFVIEELLTQGRSVGKVARHKYGCRVFQRLLEHCQTRQVEPLVDLLISDGLALASHSYGTYVMQCILEHGTEDQQHRVVAMLVRHAARLGADAPGAGVLTSAMCHCPTEDQVVLGRVLAAHPDLLVRMSYTRHGHPAVVRVLEVLDPHDRAELTKHLTAVRPSLQACRYGKLVAAQLGGA